jgi:hypothetical protein
MTGRSPSWSVAVARYGPSDEGTADIGLVVADAWQGEQRGIHEFSADVLTENRRALRVLARHTTITRRTLTSGVTSVAFSRRAVSTFEAPRHGGS